MCATRFLRIALLALGFCGFGVTAGAMQPRDCVLPGNAVLAGVIVTDCTAVKERFAAWVEAPKASIRKVYVDRHGQDRIIPKQGRKTLQENILADGLALNFDIAATPVPWRKAEAAAQAQRKGVWADERLFVKADAKLPLGEFLFISGTVTRIYKSRDTIYVNFGEDWREDFSIAIARRYWRAFGTSLEELEGKDVRVRGTIILENGPMIRISRPEQWEIRDADAR